MPEVFVITPATVKAGQIALTFGTRFLDFFRSEQLFKVEWTGPNYRKEKFLWWTTLEAGEKMVYELRGKPAFCDAILNHLHSRRGNQNRSARSATISWTFHGMIDETRSATCHHVFRFHEGSQHDTNDTAN